MKRTKFISVTLSVALISALGLGGCGSSSESKTTNETVSALSVQPKGFNAISGKVTLDETPNRQVRSLSKNQAEITAYNLDTQAIYKTTTDSSGNYELSGLSDGDYQVFAQNDQYAKNAVQRVTLAKSSRKVVDFTLTASGSVSGKIAGANVVYIPGTDHVSITDAEGNFALTGIPVGNYILMYEIDHSDQRGSVDVEVTAGDVTALDIESGISSEVNYYDEFGYVDTSLDLGVLELYHEGIPFRIHGIYGENYAYLKRFISLKNSAGEEVPYKFDLDYGEYAGDETLRIQTQEVVSAGEYTLTFSKELSEALDRPTMPEDRVYSFSVERVSVAIPNIENGSRILQLYFPGDLSATQKEALANLKVAEKGIAESLTLRSVWSGNSELALFGALKTGVEYEINPTDVQREVLGELRVPEGVLVFGDVEVEHIYPANGMQEVNVDQSLFVNVEFAQGVDTSTVEFDLNGEKFSGSAIVYDRNVNYYGYVPSNANISFKHEKLAYDIDYTLTFNAKDMSGNPISKTTTFKTLSPKVVEMDPEGMDDLFEDMQEISFNVPVDKQSGTITIENLTDSSLAAEIEREDHGYDYNPYIVDYELQSLAPNQRYKVTASGFKDQDGIEIPAKSTEFSTPPKMLFIPDQYSQNMQVSGEYFNHKVNLFFFGGLSDAEEAALEANLVVKSNGTAVIPDATHPVRKLFFIEEDSGTMLSVAFTIDPNTNYELELNDASALSDIVLPDNTKLVSFATVRKDNSATDPNAFRVIERLNVQQPYLMEGYDDQTGESSMKLISMIDMDVQIPLGYARSYKDEYGNTSYESCWSTYEHMQSDGNDLLEESLQVFAGSDAIEVEFSPNMHWSIGEHWSNNDTRICYARPQSNYGEPFAGFEADYETTYQVALNFADTLQSDAPASNLVMEKTMQTAPVGTAEFSLVDEEDMIRLYIYTNAPMITDNIDRLFNVKVNGEDFEPEFDIANSVVSVDPGIENGSSEAAAADVPNARTEFSFAVPRTLYSLLQVEISKADGEDMTFINPLTGEEVVNNSALAEPVTFVENVAPDLMPVEVKGVETTSIQNSEIFIGFNRPVNPADIATFAEDGTISDIAFEVKAGDDTTVEIIGVDGGYDGVMLTLAQELNTSKTYTLSLKEGKSIKAAFGAQELKEFEQDIALQYIEVGEMLYFYQVATGSNDPENPYMLGNTDRVDAQYESSAAVVVPLNIADGAVIDVEKSSVIAKYADFESDVLNSGALEYDAQKMALIQPIRDWSYGVYADTEVAYQANGVELSVDVPKNYLSRMSIPYVSSYYGNGLNAITFDIDNMVYDYQITPENFVVYNAQGDVIDAGVNVQFNTDTDQPTVEFADLDADSLYAVEIIGIPSYDMPSDMISEIPIDTIFIATPPAAQ